MEKGQFGYIKKYKKKLVISIVLLAMIIITGVAISLVMYKTTKTLIILIPILTSLPFAKQLVGLILCAGFQPLTKEEKQEIDNKISYSASEALLYDVSISRYEGMIFFPAVVVRDGRMLFLYNGEFKKKLSSVEELKQIITQCFESQKKKYVLMVATDLEDFIKKAQTIKEPDDEYRARDKKMREKLFELGV